MAMDQKNVAPILMMMLAWITGLILAGVPALGDSGRHSQLSHKRRGSCPNCHGFRNIECSNRL